MRRRGGRGESARRVGGHQRLRPPAPGRRNAPRRTVRKAVPLIYANFQTTSFFATRPKVPRTHAPDQKAACAQQHLKAFDQAVGVLHEGQIQEDVRAAVSRPQPATIYDMLYCRDSIDRFCQKTSTRCTPTNTRAQADLLLVDNMRALSFNPNPNPF
ncbi:unnamed protein product [Caenorhabditis auriculariae]|uniref:Uncharacterized protein n=1 Tax=Caenorhabditis auriculariae TaxID=2777116 RepID=A0A8S1GQ45_9PELO|nr:unnamed protein product [Caenorhabditis auriculariae]